MTSEQHAGIQEFVKELGGFAKTAEETLEKIEQDKEGNKGLFSVFTQRMVAIRGTAQQLNLPSCGRHLKTRRRTFNQGNTGGQSSTRQKMCGSPLGRTDNH